MEATSARPNTAGRSCEHTVGGWLGQRAVLTVCGTFRKPSCPVRLQGAAVGQGVLLLHDLLLATVLQLMAVQGLQHLTSWGIGDWGYGAIVAAAVLVLAQVTLRQARTSSVQELHVVLRFSS